MGTLIDRARGESLFQSVVLRLAVGQTEPPAVVVDDDGDVVRVGEGRRAAVERGVIEVPTCGEASCQMSLANSRGTPRSRPGRVPWQSRTGTTTASSAFGGSGVMLAA